MTQQEVTIVCSDCGGKDFECPADPKPDDMITCNGCGRQDTYKVLEALALEQLEGIIKKGSGDIFG